MAKIEGVLQEFAASTGRQWRLELDMLDVPNVGRIPLCKWQVPNDFMWFLHSGKANSPEKNMSLNWLNMKQPSLRWVTSQAASHSGWCFVWRCLTRPPSSCCLSILRPSRQIIAATSHPHYITRRSSYMKPIYDSHVSICNNSFECLPHSLIFFADVWRPRKM